MMLKFISAGFLATAYAGLLGANECTWGPTHWCSDKKVAQKCGVEDHCRDNKLGVYGLIKVEEAPLEGANECTWGPSHWCSSPAVAKKCNRESYCNKRRGRREATDYYEEEVTGAEKCTWGPGYWCASIENANECDSADFCSEQGLGAFAPEEPPIYVQYEEPMVGADECTWGPSHWCSDRIVAESCGDDAVKYCEEAGLF